MLPKVKTLEELSKIHLDVIKHSGLRWVMIRVCTKHWREGERMRRKKQSSVLSKSHKTFELLHWKLKLLYQNWWKWHVRFFSPEPYVQSFHFEICLSVIETYESEWPQVIFLSSLKMTLYAWWPFGRRKAGQSALKSKWLHAHTDTDTSLSFHPSLCGSSCKYVSFCKSKKRSQKHWNIIVRH